LLTSAPVRIPRCPPRLLLPHEVAADMRKPACSRFRMRHRQGGDRLTHIRHGLRIAASKFAPKRKAISSLSRAIPPGGDQPLTSGHPPSLSGRKASIEQTRWVLLIATIRSAGVAARRLMAIRRASSPEVADGRTTCSVGPLFPEEPDHPGIGTPQSNRGTYSPWMKRWRVDICPRSESRCRIRQAWRAHPLSAGPPPCSHGHLYRGRAGASARRHDVPVVDRASWPLARAPMPVSERRAG
jgi:hypothetical protein